MKKILTIVGLLSICLTTWAADDCATRSNDLVNSGLSPFSSEEMRICRENLVPQEQGKIICTIDQESATNYQAFIGVRNASGPGQLTLIQSYPTFEIAFQELVKRENNGECKFILNDKVTNLCKVVPYGGTLGYGALIGVKNSQRILDRIEMARFSNYQDALNYIYSYELKSACTVEK